MVVREGGREKKKVKKIMSTTNERATAMTRVIQSAEKCISDFPVKGPSFARQDFSDAIFGIFRISDAIFGIFLISEFRLHSRVSEDLRTK